MTVAQALSMAVCMSVFPSDLTLLVPFYLPGFLQERVSFCLPRLPLRVFWLYIYFICLNFTQFILFLRETEKTTSVEFKFRFVRHSSSISILPKHFDQASIECWYDRELCDSCMFSLIDSSLELFHLAKSFGERNTTSAFYVITLHYTFITRNSRISINNNKNVVM